MPGSPRSRVDLAADRHRSLYGSIATHSCDVTDRRRGERGCLPEFPTLGFVHQGIGEIRIGDRALWADPGQVVHLTGGAPYRVLHHGCTGERCATTVSLSSAGARILRQMAESRGEDLGALFSDRLYLRSPAIQRRLHLLTASVDRSRSGLEGDEEIGRRIVDLFREVVSTRAQPTPGRTSRPVEKTRFALAELLGDSPSLEELAARAGCTRFHLCRVFKSETGITINEYLHRLRLNQAMLRLASGVDDLSGLAASLGYSSHSHFTSRFRRFYGVTPSAFRAQLESGEPASEVN